MGKRENDKEWLVPGDLKVIDSTVKGGEAVLELMQKCMKKIIDEDSLEIIKINDKELER